MERRELLLGAGSRHDKLISLPDFKEWADLTTLDFNEDHKPDVIWDLMNVPLPFDDDTFDEIHAYHVLEHTGRQGDFRFFFRQFQDFWRILKPEGVLLGMGPAPGSSWVWGDPGHTRVIYPESFIFLNQQEYTNQIGKTPMTDYRFVFKGDFEIILLQAQDDSLVYGLKAVKPSRISI